MAAKFFSKIVENTFLDKFLLKTQESKVCPKKVGLFQFKVGWFKIKARTNLGPQNYMYLSAPEFSTSVEFCIRRRITIRFFSLTFVKCL